MAHQDVQGFYLTVPPTVNTFRGLMRWLQSQTRPGENAFRLAPDGGPLTDGHHWDAFDGLKFIGASICQRIVSLVTEDCPLAEMVYQSQYCVILAPQCEMRSLGADR